MYVILYVCANVLLIFVLHQMCTVSMKMWIHIITINNFDRQLFILQQFIQTVVTTYHGKHSQLCSNVKYTWPIVHTVWVLCGCERAVAWTRNLVLTWKILMNWLVLIMRWVVCCRIKCASVIVCEFIVMFSGHVWLLLVSVDHFGAVFYLLSLNCCSYIYASQQFNRIVVDCLLYFSIIDGRP